MYIQILLLREKCPNTKFFLVRIFPHLDCIRRDTPYLPVFSLNARKYGSEKLRLRTLFTLCSLKLCIITDEADFTGWISLPFNSVGIYILKVNNRNSKTRCEIWSKLTIKIPEWRYSCPRVPFLIKLQALGYLVIIRPQLFRNK